MRRLEGGSSLFAAAVVAGRIGVVERGIFGIVALAAALAVERIGSRRMPSVGVLAVVVAAALEVAVVVGCLHFGKVQKLLRAFCACADGHRRR